METPIRWGGLLCYRFAVNSMAYQGATFYLHISSFDKVITEEKKGVETFGPPCKLLSQTLDINFKFCSLFYAIHCINPAFAAMPNKPLVYPITENKNKIKNIYVIQTRSSKISRWWTWMVMNVSSLVRSTGDRSPVVWSMRVLRRSRNLWLVRDIILRSWIAFFSAVVDSSVQISWMPSSPTYLP